MIDLFASVLGWFCAIVLGVGVGGYLLREAFLRWQAHRVGKRVELLRDLTSDDSPDSRAFRVLRNRRNTWSDLAALEQLLTERRARIEADPSPEAIAALHESYDTLGIVDRHLHKLEHGRGWAERAFAARFLGEIGSAKAVAPLVRVMRNTREEDRDVRMAASRALGRIRDPRALEPLLDALAAPESWLPARVAEVILQFEDGAFDPLVQLLQKHDDSAARAWACQILGDLGNTRAVPVLISCLGDINDQVRARAASALGRLGDRRAVPELIRMMLSDPVPYVRIQVVRSLGALGDPRALHYLIDALKDGEWWVRIRVVEALEQLGDQAIEPLQLALEDRDAEVRARAAMTLERLGALDTLVERLAEFDPGAREKLLVAGQAGVVEILIEALEHQDARVRFVIVEILGEIRNTAVSAALVARLDLEGDARIRAAIVRALANLQETSAAVAISKRLGDAHDAIRIEAVRALERIPVEDPLELLAPAMRDPEPRVRAGAAVVLGKVGNDAAAPGLLELLRDSDVGVRSEAARALGFLRSEVAVPRLMESFYDHDPSVQVASARALGQIGSPACLETLVRGLENARPDLGAAIAWAVGQITWDDPDRLIDVLFQGNDRSSRLGALAALAQLGHAVGRELIRSMLADADEVVVAEAVRMLGQLRDRDALPDLHALLSSPIESTRLAVLESLCHLGDETSLPLLRRAVFDPSEPVRERAVLALGTLDDRESADLLRGLLASERSAPALRAHALLVLMVLGRDSDLETIVTALEEIRLFDFLQERRRLEDSILRGIVERVKAADCIEFRVASIQSRPELEAALVQELGSTPQPERRVRLLATLTCLSAEATYPAVWRTFHKDPAEDVRVAALRFLARFAPADEFVKLLVDALHDLQPRVRAEAMRHLHEVPSERVMSLVHGHMGTADPDLRATIVEFLADLPEPRFDEFLDHVLGAELTVEARDTLVRALGRSRHPAAPALLATFLEGDAPQLRRAAVETLQQVPAVRAGEMIERCLQDPDVRVRCGAVDAAAGLGATHGAPLLRRAMTDPDPVVRRVATLRLARVAAADAVADFERTTRDPEPSVRIAALAALAHEGTSPIEEAIGPIEVPPVAAALVEFGPIEVLQQCVAGAASPAERMGALRVLVLREPALRARILGSAALDPSPEVRALAQKLVTITSSWPESNEVKAAEPATPSLPAPAPAATPARRKRGPSKSKS